MATPTPQQAREHQQQQAAIAVAAVVAARPLFQAKAPLTYVSATVAAYQQAAVTAAIAAVALWLNGTPRTDPVAFGGWASMGFPVIEPIIATMDRHLPAPPEAVPDPWWTDWQQAKDTFMASVERTIAGQVQDAARTATQTELLTHGRTRYMRVLSLPSCDRCVILAGRIYRWSEGFQRHPLCDCTMVPVDEARGIEALRIDPVEAIRSGKVHGISEADTRAILDDGADVSRVINAAAGMSIPGIAGRYKATAEGTTPRSRWRKAHPNTLFRLRPEGIYQWVEDHHADLPDAQRADMARQLLVDYGWTLPAPIAA